MITRLWNAEPTAIIAVVSAGLALAMGFGVNVTKEQAALIQTFAIALLALLNRSQVTSPATMAAMAPKDLAKAQATPEPVKDIVQKLP